MSNQDFENHLPRDVYKERVESLSKAVNPKPYTEEEAHKIKNELREQKRL